MTVGQAHNWYQEVLVFSGHSFRHSIEIDWPGLMEFMSNKGYTYNSEKEVFI